MNFRVNILLLNLSLACAFKATAGGVADGGGFAYQAPRTALVVASSQLTEMLLSFKWPDRKACLNEQLKERYLPAIDPELMAKVISDLRHEPSKELERKNYRGELEPLVMNYGSDALGPYIEVLKPFYIGFMAYNPAIPGMLDQVKTLLLHESSHVFGYTEMEANVFSFTFINQGDTFHSPFNVRCIGKRPKL